MTPVHLCLLRRKKREILDESESMDEEDFNKQKKAHDDFMDLDLPVDTTGACFILVYDTVKSLCMH